MSKTWLESFIGNRSLGEQYQSDEALPRFCRAVATLPSGCRRVFILRKVYGLSQKEIAERLLLSQSTVEQQVALSMLLASEYMVGDEKAQGSSAPPSLARHDSKTTHKSQEGARLD